MMDSATIEYYARKAARESAKAGVEPAILTADDLGNLRRGRGTRVRIPFIGDRWPRGWKPVDLREWFPEANGWDPKGVYPDANRGKGAFFVDLSGFGAEDEPALTLEQFAALARPGFGYAVVEAGQFQGHVAVFEPR